MAQLELAQLDLAQLDLAQLESRRTFWQFHEQHTTAAIVRGHNKCAPLVISHSKAAGLTRGRSTAGDQAKKKRKAYAVRRS